MPMVAMSGSAGEWAWWVGLVFGAVPLLCLAVWHATDAWYCAAFALKHGNKKSSDGVRRRLPPGHMGIPFLGETLSLLWYFQLVRRPDEFIAAKKRAYGGKPGLYRTHLLGSPTIIACTPAANKFVLQSAEAFGIRWPVAELVGLTSVVNVEGASHVRLRGFILAAISRPSSLRNIAAMVQPNVVAALQAWADKGTIVAATEIRKVTFTNICKMFVSMEPSPLTDKIDQWFRGLLAGFRAFPLDFPGTASHAGRKCRRNLDTAFREELDARKKVGKQCDDLMNGFMQMENEKGEKLSDEEVVDNIVSLVIAGYESTTSAIMWATYHLANSPIALAKLREENEPAKPGTFQVFGGGPRICAGNMLARLQLTIILHHLSVGYEWELLNPDAEIDYLPHPRPVDGAAMTFRKLATTINQNLD
ncbi:unnamed protein product [Alopecurus aequalis]